MVSFRYLLSSFELLLLTLLSEILCLSLDSSAKLRRTSQIRVEEAGGHIHNLEPLHNL